MITEDYVSFETAKLLKEKGFDGHSIFTIYDENAANAYIKELEEKHLPFSSDDPKLKEFNYIQPTLQMAMKWLREVHNIVIEITSIWVENFGYNYIARIVVEGESKKILKHYNHHEQACDAAIKYCLENLI